MLESAILVSIYNGGRGDNFELMLSHGIGDMSVMERLCKEILREVSNPLNTIMHSTHRFSQSNLPLTCGGRLLHILMPRLKGLASNPSETGWRLPVEKCDGFERRLNGLVEAHHLQTPLNLIPLATS